MSRIGRWPTALASRVTGRVARLPVPSPLRGALLGTTARLLGMNLSEAERPVTAYRSLDELFVRRLHPGARSWPVGAGVPGSPVDGVVGQGGRVREGRLLQVKGREYTVAELLDDRTLAARFEHGTYLTLYLAPRHYHRIHAPVSGRISRARHIPGRLLPVNRPAALAIDRLFPRNERLVCVIEPEPGGAPGDAVAVVAVGAFNVGRITASFDPDLETNRRGARAETHVYHPAIRVARGDDLMAFHLGSTVVLLFEDSRTLDPELRPGVEVRVGRALSPAPRRSPD